MSRKKRSLQLAVGLAASGVFLWLAFGDVAFADVWASMGDANPLWLGLTILVSLVGRFARGQRWGPLFRRGTGVKVGDAFAAQTIGFAGNTVLPFRAGEALKALSLSRRAELPFSTVIATVVLERVFDLIGVGLLLGAAMLLVPIPETAGARVELASQSLATVIGLAVGGCIFFVFARRPAMRLTDRVLGFLPERLSDPLSRLVHSFVDGLDALGDGKQLAMALLLTLWVWFCLALPFGLTGLAFGFGDKYGASPWELCVVCAAMVAAFTMIPSAPGFVGTFQAGCVVALAVFGVPRDEALGFSLLVHVLTFAPTTLIGLVLAFRQGIMGHGAASPEAEAPADAVV